MPGVVPLKRVAQLNSFGCAAASVAMVAQVTYGKVMSKVLGSNWRRSNTDHGLYTSQMIRLLRSEFDMSVGFSRGFDFKSGSRAILFLDNSILFHAPPRHFWHCIVWDPAFGGRIIDPGFSRSESRAYYLDLWKRGGRETLIVNPRN